MRKFYKTTLTFVVLSEDEPVTAKSIDDLRSIVDACDRAGYVGMVEKEENTELTSKEAAQELSKLGSEPEFFQLDSEGRELVEDEEENLTLCATCRVKHHDICGDDKYCSCCSDSRREL